MSVKAGLTVKDHRKRYFLDDKSKSVLTIARHILVNMYANYSDQSLITFDCLTTTIVSLFLVLGTVVSEVFISYLVVAFILNIVLKAGLTRYELITMTFRVWTAINLLKFIF